MLGIYGGRGSGVTQEFESNNIPGSVLHCIVLCCAVQADCAYSSLPCCIVLHCIVMCCAGIFLQYYNVLCCTAATHCIVLFCSMLCCIVLSHLIVLYWYCTPLFLFCTMIFLLHFNDLCCVHTKKSDGSQEEKTIARYNTVRYSMYSMYMS